MINEDNKDDQNDNVNNLIVADSLDELYVKIFGYEKYTDEIMPMLRNWKTINNKGD